jgi:hypothetical protein
VHHQFLPKSNNSLDEIKIISHVFQIILPSPHYVSFYQFPKHSEKLSKFSQQNSPKHKTNPPNPIEKFKKRSPKTNPGHKITTPSPEPSLFSWVLYVLGGSSGGKFGRRRNGVAAL